MNVKSIKISNNCFNLCTCNSLRQLTTNDSISTPSPAMGYWFTTMQTVSIKDSYDITWIDSRSSLSSHNKIKLLSYCSCDAYVRGWLRSSVIHIIVSCHLSAPSHYLNQHWLIRDQSRKSHNVPLLYYNAPFCNRNEHLYAHFSHNMVHCGILVWSIMGFVGCVYYFCMKRIPIFRKVNFVLKRGPRLSNIWPPMPD